MTSLCKKESICAVHEKQTQAKQLSVKQQVRQHGARLQVTDSDGITMRKRVAHSLQPHQETRCTAQMGLQIRTTNHSPCALELNPEPTRRSLEVRENYTHKVQRFVGGFECELLHIKAKREEKGGGKKRGERGESAAGHWRDNIIKSKRRRGKKGKVKKARYPSWPWLDEAAVHGREAGG